MRSHTNLHGFLESHDNYPELSFNTPVFLQAFPSPESVFLKARL